MTTFLTLAAWAVMAAPGPEDAGSVERIVVIESARPRSAGELPASITAFGPEDIRAAAFSHIQELLNQAPGVAVQRGNGREHLTAIRSPVFTGGAGAGSFLYLEEGVPLRAAGFANINGLFESVPELAGGVELVRGPGGPLYGSNAVHGVIDLRAHEPEDDRGGFAEVFGGTFERVRGAGRVEGGWGPHRAFAGGVLFSEDDFREASGVDEQKAQAGHVFVGEGVTARSLASFTNLNQETAGFIQGPDAFRFRDITRSNPTPEAFRDARSARLQTRIAFSPVADWDVGVTPFARWNDQNFILFFLPSEALEDSGHWSVGLQARARWTGIDGFDLLVGADLDRTRGFLREVQERPTIFSFTQGVHYDYRVRSVQAALYGLAEWEARPGLRLTAGLRLERMAYDYVTRAAPGDEGRFRRPENRRDRFLSPTAKLGASWDATPWLTLRASWTRAARAPQTSDLYRIQPTQNPDEINRERLDAGEAGASFDILGGRLDLVGFWMRKEDVIFRDADGLNVDGAVTRHRGLEASWRQPLARFFSVVGSFTYALHQYRFDRPVASPSSSIRFGDDIDTAPRTIGRIAGVLTPTPDWRFSLSLSHIGPYATDPGGTNRYGGHELVDVDVSWRPRSGSWRFFAGVRNLFNRDYAERADFAFGSERFFPGRGLSAFGGLALDY